MDALLRATEASRTLDDEEDLIRRRLESAFGLAAAAGNSHAEDHVESPSHGSSEDSGEYRVDDGLHGSDPLLLSGSSTSSDAEERENFDDWDDWDDNEWGVLCDAEMCKNFAEDQFFEVPDLLRQVLWPNGSGPEGPWLCGFCSVPCCANDTCGKLVTCETPFFVANYNKLPDGVAVSNTLDWTDNPAQLCHPCARPDVAAFTEARKAKGRRLMGCSSGSKCRHGAGADAKLKSSELGSASIKPATRLKLVAHQFAMAEPEFGERWCKRCLKFASANAPKLGAAEGNPTKEIPTNATAAAAAPPGQCIMFLNLHDLLVCSCCRPSGSY